MQPGKATPAEDSAAFPPLVYAPTGAPLWSSTPLRSDPTRAWIIDFATGETGTLVALPPTPTASVRCVKLGRAASRE